MKKPRRYKGYNVHYLPFRKETIDVVGEYYRRKSVERAWEKGKVGVAILFPDQANPHDQYAVKVIMNGIHIGFIDATSARAIQPALVLMQRRKGVVFGCTAQIIEENDPDETMQAYLYMRFSDIHSCQGIDLSIHFKKYQSLYKKLFLYILFTGAAFYLSWLIIRFISYIFMELFDFIRLGIF